MSSFLSESLFTIASAATALTTAVAVSLSYVAYAGWSSEQLPPAPRRRITLIHATTTGVSEKLAGALAHDAQVLYPSLDAVVVGAGGLTLDGLLALAALGPVIFLWPTWTDGASPPVGAPFAAELEEAATDFRVSHDLLTPLKFATFSIGHGAYPMFGSAGRAVDEHLAALSATRLAPVGVGDVSGDVSSLLNVWAVDHLWPALDALFPSDAPKSHSGSPGSRDKRASEAVAEGAYPVDRRVNRGKATGFGESGELTRRQYRRANREAAEERAREAAALARKSAAAAAAAAASPAVDVPNEEDAFNDALLATVGAGSAGSDVEIENLGSALEAAARSAAAASRGELPDMITPTQRKALTKEGYKLIGTHAAVKVCRWTKSQLRGAGGCYKHSLYNISSSHCMEATPSLSCASACTFCWRHGKNPVGREWRWKVDDPAFIVSEAVKKHVAAIHELRGLPGVDVALWEDAHTVRHCALSLVGEPISYPRINELVGELHARGISSFLVTNAQYPASMRALRPVTQLYCSIDAADKETLKAIDRPLFPDFYERYLECLDILATKPGRTVFRLTLLKSTPTAKGNMEPEMLDAYAALVERGRPSFIELKGVTFSGVGSSITMGATPWHPEVKAFSLALMRRLNERAGVSSPHRYGAAAEHAHSCCVLLAREEYRFPPAEGGAPVWHTHIDFPRFLELAQKFDESGGEDTFRGVDYALPTPHWALFGSPEAGFSPSQVRVRREGAEEAARLKMAAQGVRADVDGEAAGCGDGCGGCATSGGCGCKDAGGEAYVPSESGCG